MAKLTVNKQSVEDYLKQGQKMTFVIPEYQREYSWTVEQCETIWDDIVTFFDGEEEEYFLGPVVAFKNDKGDFEIIDGQQRTTTLFLLLRAFYTKIEQLKPDEKKGIINRYKRNISICLWQEDPDDDAFDFSKPNIKSLSATDSHNAAFLSILETGDSVEKENNYHQNYQFFLEKIKELQLSRREPFRIINNILEKLILMPIEADNQESALTIFSTLNDRGLSLTDADIFKAQIYKQLESEEKSEFIEGWKNLSERVDKLTYVKDIDNLFYVYMMYLRGKNGDINSTTPGLRRFFSSHNFAALKEENVFSNILKLLDFFEYVEELSGNERYQSHFEINKYVDVLRNFPNDWWKYPLATFFLNYHESKEFTFIFRDFVKELTRVMYAKLSENPTVNHIKSTVLDINVQIFHSDRITIDTSKYKSEDMVRNIRRAKRKFERGILYLYTYLHDSVQELLPEKVEIEHILPRNHQTLVPKSEWERVAKVIDLLGNKMLLEKSVNIRASDRYFLEKKKRYNDSSINLAKKIANQLEDNFSADMIESRQEEMENVLLDFFKVTKE